MRHLDTLPAWAARQRSRRLGRHSDDKVVRWISHGHDGKTSHAAQASEPSSNDNVVAFVPVRAAQAC